MKKHLKKWSTTVISGLFKVVGLFQAKDVIYFESFHGKQVSDNPLAIYRACLALAPELKLVWGATKGSEALFEAAGVPYVRRFSWRWFLTMPRARAWVINTRTPLFLSKNPRTFYVQTWHGTPWKKIGLDIPEVQITGYDTQAYRQEFQQESARWDLLLAPNPYCEELFPQAFGYRGPLLTKGYPRNDQLVNWQATAGKRSALRAQLGVSEGQKLVLYAPTWRENQRQASGGYQFALPFEVAEVAAAIGPDSVLLLRMHYLVSAAQAKENWPANVQDVSDYPDMSDLLLIADLLVTDYSSSFFDFSIMKKPIIFYLPDQTEYANELRGLYFPVSAALPGPICETRAALLAALAEFRANPAPSLSRSYESFYQTFCQTETGQAAEAVAQLIARKQRT